MQTTNLAPPECLVWAMNRSLAARPQYGIKVTPVWKKCLEEYKAYAIKGVRFFCRHTTRLLNAVERKIPFVGKIRKFFRTMASPVTNAYLRRKKRAEYESVASELSGISSVNFYPHSISEVERAMNKAVQIATETAERGEEYAEFNQLSVSLFERLKVRRAWMLAKRHEAEEKMSLMYEDMLSKLCTVDASFEEDGEKIS